MSVVVLALLNYFPYIVAAICVVCFFIIMKVVYKTHIHINKNGFWYLYLDDEREIPNHYSREHRWVICRTSEEAKQIVMKYGIPTFMSLDHDLGGDDTSMKFLHWLAEEYYNDPNKNENLNTLIVPGYVVHSQNPVGAANIKSYMECWKKVYKPV